MGIGGLGSPPPQRGALHRGSSPLATPPVGVVRASSNTLITGGGLEPLLDARGDRRVVGVELRVIGYGDTGEVEL